MFTHLYQPRAVGLNKALVRESEEYFPCKRAWYLER